MKTLFVSLIFIVSLSIVVQAQHPTPQLLKEPANWGFEQFPLPPEFAPGISYKGIEELRFCPGMFKKDTVTYFTYAFVAQLDNVTSISQNDINDYLLKYYKGLCSNVAKDRKLVIDTTKITVAVEKKKGIAANEIIYNASLNIFGVFADGAPVKLNMEVKVLKNAPAKKTYLVFITSPHEKTDPIWKELHQIQKDFTLESITTAQEVKEPKPFSEDWTKPYQPFRIVGNLYYVGTYDLACYLIVTPKGNILINTGLAASAEEIKNNIQTLGFRFADTKILLTTQAHFDHMGAMAEVKKETGAKFMVDEKDAAIAKDGGSSDYALGGNGMAYAPVMPDRLLHNGDKIKLGNMQVVILHHPGHTKGSCSYLLTINDAQRSYRVLIANLPTIVTDKPFAAITDYPEVANDYAYTFKAMKALTFDIWLASHASQFNMHTKHKPGDAYNPAAFIDRAGYDAQLNDLQKKFEEKLKIANRTN